MYEIPLYVDDPFSSKVKRFSSYDEARAFAFWREVASGEDVANRGSALNARLGSLPDQAQGEHETNKTKEKTK